MNSDRVTLKIPRPLYEKIKAVIDDTGYRSVNEFVVYVLRDIMAGQPQEGQLRLTEQEVQIVRNRLRKLGYL